MTHLATEYAKQEFKELALDALEFAMDFNDPSELVNVGVDYSTVANVLTLRVSHEDHEDFLFYRTIYFNLIETVEQLNEARVAVNVFKAHYCV